MDEKKPITIYDVAREAGVSMATVSRVVNGNVNVKPSTREKVQEVIKRLDYRPNAVARGLVSRKTTTIGVMIPDITNLFYASLALGIDDIASMYKYNIILENSDKAIMSQKDVLQSLLSKQVDGVIYMGHDLTDDLRELFKDSNVPVVCAGSVDVKGELGSVNIDYEAATKEAVNLLIKNGNEKIVLLVGSLETPISGTYRLNGYKAALEENGIPFNEDLVLVSNYSFEQGRELYQKIKTLGATAVFSGDDELAVGVLNAAILAGEKVPEDMEIITSNNTKVTKISRPQLSSIGQPLYDIGAVSMRLLTKYMNKEEVEENTVIVNHTIEQRGTTK